LESIMLPSASYSVTPQSSDPRRHQIPVEVIEHLTGERERGALDGARCLLDITVVTHAAQARALGRLVLEPTSGGEIRIGKRTSEDYPEIFPAGAFLVVAITKLG
jgi:hypothetical protein